MVLDSRAGIEEAAVSDAEPTWACGLIGPARQIALLDASPIRIAAGPGTGKTWSLMRRVARLLDRDGIDPERLWIVTFTRTAAADLVSNLENLGVPGADRVRAGTLHSHCFGVLSRAGFFRVTGRVPRPLVDFETRIMQEDLKSGGWGIRESKRLLNAFGAAWARLQDDDPGWPRTDGERAFRDNLQAWLRFHEGMLLDELVPETRRYFRDNPQCPELQAFDHVLVDEYQDLNRADQDVIDRVAAAGSLLVIGDEDQAIYTGLRFAHPESIREFDARHDGTMDVPLVECRRCPRDVVTLANALIRNNNNRAPRVLQPFADAVPGRVIVLQWPNLEAEAEGVASVIADAINTGIATAGRVLVLAPRRTLGYAIRDRLRARGVTTHSYFSEEALDERDAQERFTLLQLLANRLDRVAFRCWLGFGSPTYRASAYARLRSHCETTGGSPVDELGRLRRGEIQLQRCGELVTRLDDLETRLAPLEALQGTALLDSLFPDGDVALTVPRSIGRSVIAEQGDGVDAQTLLNEVRSRVTQPELPVTVDFVRVMSLHKSKGLTADLVVVAGCVEGWIPTLSEGLPPSEADAALEEQRRLFYVAITRPTQILVISSFREVAAETAHRMRVRIARRRGRNVVCQSSRFLSELGPSAPPARAAAVGFRL